MTTSRTLRGRLLALCFLVLGTDAVAVTRIMLTNDDGIASPGMQALFTAVSAIPDTEVKVIAPATDQSGTGSGVTIFAPLTLDSNAHLLNGIDAGIALGGKPADTVRFAVDRIYTDGVRPDLVISGINRGQNVGLAFGSGTVGAAQQASMPVPCRAWRSGTS